MVMPAALTTAQVDALNALYDHMPELGKAAGLDNPLLGDMLLSLQSAEAGDAAAIGITDAGGLFTATDVEAALAEVKTLADAGMTVQKRTLTIGHADLTDADGSQTLNLGAVLPANARAVGVEMRSYTPFTGGGASAVSVDIGTAGDVDALVDGADLFAAAVDGGPATMPQGVRPNKFLSAAQLLATVAADVNVADLTAGSVVIDVLFVVIA